jgi:hypothetical protein
MRKTMRLLAIGASYPEEQEVSRKFSQMRRKIKVYGAQVMSTIVFLAVLYTAARYEVMGVLHEVSRNDVVASPQTR